MKLAFLRIMPSKRLQRLIEEFHGRGGVVNYAFYGASAFPKYDAHREAAAAFLTESFDLHDEQLIGTPVDWETFWNNDHTYGTSSSVSGYRTAFFQPPQGLRSRNEELSSRLVPGVVPEFDYVHYDNITLFEQINANLFPGLDADSIYSWSPHCSSFFEAGLEYWGAYLWTLLRLDVATVTVIAASATD